MAHTLKRKPNPTLEKHYKEQGSCCYYCGDPVEFSLITRDHIVPKIKGGTLANNSLFACFKCNSTKSALELEEFRQVVLKRLVSMIKSIVKNNFKVTQSTIDKFRRNHRILMSVAGLIENGGKPQFGNVK